MQSSFRHIPHRHPTTEVSADKQLIHREIQTVTDTLTKKRETNIFLISSPIYTTNCHELPVSLQVAGRRRQPRLKPQGKAIFRNNEYKHYYGTEETRSATKRRIYTTHRLTLSHRKDSRVTSKRGTTR